MESLKIRATALLCLLLIAVLGTAVFFWVGLRAAYDHLTNVWLPAVIDAVRENWYALRKGKTL